MSTQLKVLKPVATFAESGGSVVQSNPLAAVPPNQCFDARLFDVAGSFRTGDDGKVLFRLAKFICPGMGATFIDPVNVVATPVSSTPCFLTLAHSLVNQGTDVEIKVATWGAGGAAAPNVAFDWRCRVALKLIIAKKA